MAAESTKERHTVTMSGLKGDGDVVVVVNERAGAVLQRGKAAFVDDLKNAFTNVGVNASIHCVPATSLSKTVEDIITSGPSLLVVAGGDGTVSKLLPSLQRGNVPVAILPLGTFNLLGRDLGLNGGVGQNVASIVAGHRHSVDLALLNDRPFHSNAGLGFYGMMAREREAARGRFPFSKSLAVAFAALKSAICARPISVRVEIDGVRKTLAADAVLVTNNRFDGTPWRRVRLDEGVLEVHLLQAPTLFARLRTAVAVARGRWRDLPNLTILTATDVTLHRRFKRKSTVSIDGEMERLSGPMRFRIRPASLHLPGARRHDE
jgi:diacylglycerol kinase family enzyme